MDYMVHIPNSSIYNLYAYVNLQMFSSNMCTTIRAKNLDRITFFCKINTFERIIVLRTRFFFIYTHMILILDSFVFL